VHQAINKNDQQPRVILASYSDTTIRVYQAYNDSIADSAIANGSFVSPPFKLTRMTWIKPSFLWMMYRSGWGDKDSGQSRILAIDMSRDGFEWALSHSSLATNSYGFFSSEKEFKEHLRSQPVRVQWDPDRDLFLNALPRRAIQIGLSGEAVERYVGDWIVELTDITSECRDIKQLVDRNQLDEAQTHLPAETPYPLPPETAHRIAVLD